MSNDTQSRVLMVIPTLGDRLDLLHETLQSIVNQEAQRPDIVVVCPINSVGARELAAEFGAEVVDDPRGLSAAVNAGFAHAKSQHEFVTWMGDDDLLRAGSLATSVKLLDSNKNAAVVYGYCDYIDAKSDLIFTNRAGWLALWLMSWGPNLVPLPGSLLRLSAVKKVGGYDESLKYAMDLDLFLRLRKTGAFLSSKQTLAAFRWHPESTTVANRKASIDEAEAVKRRYLPRALRWISPIWEVPVRHATLLAAQRVSKMASEK